MSDFLTFNCLNSVKNTNNNDDMNVVKFTYNTDYNRKISKPVFGLDTTDHLQT